MQKNEYFYIFTLKEKKQEDNFTDCACVWKCRHWTRTGGMRRRFSRCHAAVTRLSRPSSQRAPAVLPSPPFPVSPSRETRHRPTECPVIGLTNFTAVLVVWYAQLVTFHSRPQRLLAPVTVRLQTAALLSSGPALGRSIADESCAYDKAVESPTTARVDLRPAG